MTHRAVGAHPHPQLGGVPTRLPRGRLYPWTAHGGV